MQGQVALASLKATTAACLLPIWEHICAHSLDENPVQVSAVHVFSRVVWALPVTCELGHRPVRLLSLGHSSNLVRLEFHHGGVDLPRGEAHVFASL